MWAGPNTEWLKECDIKLELACDFYERREEVGEGCLELISSSAAGAAPEVVPFLTAGTENRTLE